MTGSARQKGFAVLAVAFALAPFAFGSIRAIQTGSDYRMLWMAVASAHSLRAEEGALLSAS